MAETTLRPHLACDIDLSTLSYPLIGMPKVDGVRGMHISGKFTGRSLKAFKNPFISELFNHDIYSGIDGELALGDITHPRLCSLTTGFVNRKTKRPGKPTVSTDLQIWAFDYLHSDVVNEPYHVRLAALTRLFTSHCEKMEIHPLRLMPWKWIDNIEELLAFDDECLEMGFEGSIFRDPEGLHYSGRASTKGKRPNAYLRLKQFIDFEGIVVDMWEAMENTNEKKINELGRSERSTHQGNMIPKGMMGGVVLNAFKDVLDPVTGTVLIKEGQHVDVGPGNMPHDQRKEVWEAYMQGRNDCIIGQIGKAKFFPRGQKDKPRFPTWVGLRAEEDISE